MSSSPEEKILVFKTLERAILDACQVNVVLHTCVKISQRQRRNARSWIFEEYDPDYFEPWSFAWVCQILDLEPPTVQRIVKRAIREGTSFIKPGSIDNHKIFSNLFDFEALESLYPTNKKK